MSKITRTKCDACGKEVVDSFAEEGWIELHKLHVKLGRSGPKQQARGYEVNGVDLCSVGCLVTIIARRREEHAAEEAGKRLEAEANMPPLVKKALDELLRPAAVTQPTPFTNSGELP